MLLPRYGTVFIILPSLNVQYRRLIYITVLDIYAHVYTTHDIIITVFPRNLAAATFNFVVQFGAGTFRRRLDFEGGDSSTRNTTSERTHCALFRININVLLCNVHEETNDDPFPHAARIRGRLLVH